MANPVTYPLDCGDVSHVKLHIAFSVGGTGAVGTIDSETGREFDPTTPVTRTGPGVYDILFKESWVGLRGFYGHILPASYSASAGNMPRVTANTLNTAKKITVTTRRDDTGAAADPGNGDIVSLTFMVAKLKQRQ